MLRCTEKIGNKIWSVHPQLLYSSALPLKNVPYLFDVMSVALLYHIIYVYIYIYVYLYIYIYIYIHTYIYITKHCQICDHPHSSVQTLLLLIVLLTDSLGLVMMFLKTSLVRIQMSVLIILLCYS